MPNFKMNCYNDDGGWWTLAYYQVYQLYTLMGQTSAANAAGNNFKAGLNAIMSANFNNQAASHICNKQGILWCNSDTSCKTCNCGCPYKNAIANELFLDALVKAKISFPDYYNTTVIGQYGYNFDDTLSWFTGSGMIASNYQIHDGLDGSSCQASGGIYTYNQGVILYPLIKSGKYNNILFGILQESYNQYTVDNGDGFGRVWGSSSCSNSDVSDGTIFDAIFIRYVSDIMTDLKTINSTLANQWTSVIDNTVTKIRLNNQSAASNLYPCPLNYLLIDSSTSLNKPVTANVWIKSTTTQNNNPVFLAMDNTGKVYNYVGDAINNNDLGNPGWILQSTNNGLSYCAYNPWIDSQTSGKYKFLSASSLGGSCNQSIWNGQANYGNVIQGASACLRDEVFYIELLDANQGTYSIRCAKCNLSPNIAKSYHPLYVGSYNGGPGYNTGAGGNEQYTLYLKDSKAQLKNLQYIKMKDAAINQATQYTQLQWFVAALTINR